MTAATTPSFAEQRAVLEAIEDLEVRRAQLHAESLQLRATMAELFAKSRAGFAEMELAGSAQIGQIRAARELDDATRLMTLFPKTEELPAAGAVFVPAVDAILQATRRCT